MKMHAFSALILLITVNHIFAQSFERFEPKIYRNGVLLKSPFAGGLRAGQFSEIDLDGDGIKDLFVFDRNGDVGMTFINEGIPGQISYRHAPEYEALFPRMHSWALLKDFNGDGIEDLFTASGEGVFGIEVWRGKRDSHGLYFEKMKFNFGNPGDYMKVKIPNGTFVNIYVSNVDLPSLTDIDGDGDIDILSFEPDGSNLYYYKNIAIENNLGQDTFDMIIDDICFGKFSENDFNETIYLSEDPAECAPIGPFGHGAKGERHAGSTVTAFDWGCNGLIDLFIGDLGSPRLVYLRNGGTQNQGWMTSYISAFPPNEPIDLNLFLAAFILDVNNDGLVDLIATPNERDNGQTVNHIWVYLNEGSNCEPQFKLHTKNFLVEDMIFFGSASHPAVCDFNADGKPDLIVGSNGLIKERSERENRLYLLENISNANEMAFNIVDEDYLGLSNTGNNTGRFAPAIGDLDSDGDDDLLLGDFRGMLLHFENQAGMGKTYEFGQPIVNYSNIFVGQNAAPQIIDLDYDGLADLVIGENNNELNFFKNIGTVGSPLFNPNASQAPNTNQLGAIFSGTDFNTRSGSPSFFKAKDGLYMLLGVQNGDLILYDNITALPNEKFNLIAKNWGNVYVGRRVNPEVADLDNDGFFELILGNERGGLDFFKTDFEKMVASNMEFAESINVVAYPNPVRNMLYLQSDYNFRTYQIFNSIGSVVQNGVLYSNRNEIDFQRLTAGIYWIRLDGANKVVNLKITKL